MDLFQARTTTGHQPLADRLRPQSWQDFVGQSHPQGPRRLLQAVFERGAWPGNLIFWGPPGSGKTTLARLLAHQLESEFVEVHAVGTGAKDLREIGEAARQRIKFEGRRTLLFVDEIHRLNRAQQDVLLPYTERGDLAVVGATTENPSYELNSALLSRARVVVFSRLNETELHQVLDRALTSSSEFSQTQSQWTQEARSFLVQRSDGDARRLLSDLEQVQSHLAEFGSGPLTSEGLSGWLAAAPLRYDAQADEHYDTISAFIKAVRGSDPDAAVYYLARMLKGGEDPVFIARRLVVLASEDVGNADPRALSLATAGLQAVELVGMPEAAINLAQVTTYLASAPKSNAAYMALRRAESEVEKSGTLPIPLSLRSARTKLSDQLGYGKGYKYSHDSARGYVAQEFLPEPLRGMKFYEPKDIGFEKNIRAFLTWLKEN